MDTFRLKVKLGSAEFEGEGPEGSVKEQFAAFMDAVRSAPVQKATLRAETAGVSGPEQPGEALDGISNALLERVFSVKDNVISLRFLPKTDKRESDALLLIMLAYQMIQKQDHVSAVMLGVAARQSGLSIDRVDRAMAPNDALVAKGGLRRGTRYSLNNQGILHAKQLLTTAFG